MQQNALTLDYRNPEKQGRPIQAWIGFYAAILSPLVVDVSSAILDAMGANPAMMPPTARGGWHYGSPQWYPHGTAGAVRFAADFTLMNILPMASVVYGISGFIRSRDSHSGKTLSLVGLLIGAWWLLITL